ncbi:MAG: AMP-binding protein [Kofleriaceae bacterium]
MGVETIRLGLAECVAHWGRYQPDRIAIDSGNATVTYRQLDREVQRVANYLHTQLSEVQQPVGVIADAPIAFFTCLMGVLRQGGQIVVLNPFLTPEVLQAAVDDAGCRIVLVDDSPSSTVPMPRLTGVKTVLFSEIAALPMPGPGQPTCIRLTTWAWGTIYSSGTTGVPKGIVQGDTAMRNELVSWAMEVPITRRDGNVYVGRPVFFTGGLVIAATALFVGGTMIAPIQHTVEFYWECCARMRVDVAFFIPDQLRALVDAAQHGIKGESGARTILSMGSTLPRATKIQIPELLGSEVIESWANTEGIGTITDPSDVSLRPGSAGRPFLTDEIVILDEDGNKVLPGTIGRVAGASGTQLLEFRNRPDLNKAMFVNNYVVSEDLGYLDEDGYLYIVGRQVERFLRNGTPVYAVDIEHIILGISDVEQVSVIGRPDATEGNVPVAAVVLRPGSRMTERDLIAEVNDKLTIHQKLQQIRFVESFERNAAGKIIPASVSKFFESASAETNGEAEQDSPYMREVIQLEWNPRAFLRQEYSQPTIPDDQAAFLEFFARGLKKIGREFDRGLELGGGPTLHRAAQLVRWVRRLDLADCEPSNLDQIRLWLSRDPSAHDWSTYIGGKRGVVACEGSGTLGEREALLRGRIGELIEADIRRPSPLTSRPRYPIVTSCFCLEWATPSLAGWRANFARAAALVDKGGWMFMLGVHDTDGRLIHGRRYGCARVKQTDVSSELEKQGFDPRSIHLEVTPGTSVELDDVREIFMVYAQKQA